MKPVLRAWLSIQRLRIAHLLFPDLFVKGWTPNTIAQTLENEELFRRREALERDCAAFDAEHHPAVAVAERDPPQRDRPTGRRAAARARHAVSQG